LAAESVSVRKVKHRVSGRHNDKIGLMQKNTAFAEGVPITSELSVWICENIIGHSGCGWWNGPMDLPGQLHACTTPGKQMSHCISQKNMTH